MCIARLICGVDNMKKINRKSLSGIFLHVIAWFEIIYNGFTILGILGLKIYTSPIVQKEILKLKGKLKELQYHLRGLGVAWVEIDVETVESLLHGLIWFIFVLGMVWLLTNFFMAIHLLRGLRQGRARNLKTWIIFGIISLILNVLCYPLEVVICGQAKSYLGPICEPSGDNAWLKICVKLIYYSSVWVAWIHRRDLLLLQLQNHHRHHQSKVNKVPFQKSLTMVTLNECNGGGGGDNNKFFDNLTSTDVNDDDDDTDVDNNKEDNANSTNTTELSQISHLLESPSAV